MNKQIIAAMLLCAALLLVSGSAVLIMLTGASRSTTDTQQPNANDYSVDITGPWGTVYPYSENVKNYLMTEGTASHAYFKEGTEAKGDTSFAPVIISWQDTAYSGLTAYCVTYGTKQDLSDGTTVRVNATDDKKVELYNLYKDTTYYVQVTAYAGQTAVGQTGHSFRTSALGPRILRVPGIHNCRDLGGYVTVDGKQVLQGMVFRGGEMDAANAMLTPEGEAILSQQLGIRTDMDLRGNGSDSPISSANKEAFAIGGYLEAFSQADQYSQIFALFADESKYPVYIHCAGGADRTGTVCYLLNALLGVPEDILIQDYEMTSYSMYGARTRDSEVYDFPAFVEKLMTYPGETVQEKTESYMLSIGVTQEQIQNIRNILLTDYTLNENDPYDGQLSSTCAIPAELAQEKPEHVFDFSNWSSNDFTLDYLGKVTETADSPVGMCASFDVGQWSGLDKSAFSVTAKKPLKVTLQVKPGVERVIGQLSYSELSANADDGKYHLYKIANITGWNACEANSVLCLFDGAFTNRGIPQGVLQNLENSPVDLYISMKIDGDITCNRPDRMPVYSIDRMLVVTDCTGYVCQSYVSNNDATCADGTKSGTCPICKGISTIPDTGTGKGHVFTNYVSNSNGTADVEGTKTAMCDYGCGAFHTVYESGGMLPEELAGIDPQRIFVFDSSYFTGEVYQVEQDAESVEGEAMVIRAGEHGGTNNNPYRIAPTNPLHISFWSSRESLVCDLYQEDVYQDGRYHLYKISDLNILNEDRYNFLYIFTTWHLRSYTLPKTLLNNGAKGKTMDCYLSMKIEGNVDCQDSQNMPVYYIDRIIFVVK